MKIPTTEQRLAVREAPQGRPVMRQRWDGLLFLHWAADAETIAGRLPRGLHVDLYDGRAWLGIVPFFMARVRPAGFAPMPWLSWFMELNVRTYVHDDEGNPGVWFFSLDCNQPLAVEIARRSFHLPYQHASMRSVIDGSRIQYHCRRKAPEARDAYFDYHMAAETQPAEAGSLEWFLVERYLLFSTNRRGELFTGQVRHTPYQISPARCDAWSCEPLRLDGFMVPETPPLSMLAAAPVEVAIHPLARRQPPDHAGE